MLLLPEIQAVRTSRKFLLHREASCNMRCDVTREYVTARNRVFASICARGSKVEVPSWGFCDYNGTECTEWVGEATRCFALGCLSVQGIIIVGTTSPMSSLGRQRGHQSLLFVNDIRATASWKEAGNTRRLIGLSCCEITAIFDEFGRARVLTCVFCETTSAN